jgi:hypothetical protein
MKTARIMIEIFCRHFHQIRPCKDCDELLEYLEKKIEKCPYAADKPACTDCPIHCYQKDMRSRIQMVMRFSGPRMIYRHPVLALRHLLRNKTPVRLLPSCFPETE